MVKARARRKVGAEAQDTNKCTRQFPRLKVAYIDLSNVADFMVKAKHL